MCGTDVPDQRFRPGAARRFPSMADRKCGWRRSKAAIFFATMILTLASVMAAAQEFKTEDGPFRVVTVASGLEHPWGLAFLPDGRMLVTERPGRLRIVARGRCSPSRWRAFRRYTTTGQGGLLDVALDPAFRRQPTGLSLLRRARRKGRRHRRGARPARRGERGGPPGGRAR